MKKVFFVLTLALAMGFVQQAAAQQLIGYRIVTDAYGRLYRVPVYRMPTYAPRYPLAPAPRPYSTPSYNYGNPSTDYWSQRQAEARRQIAEAEKRRAESWAKSFRYGGY